MEKRIAIMTSGHPPFDERIFWKFGRSFQMNGYEVSIICSTTEINDAAEGIRIFGFDSGSLDKNQKINEFREQLELINPDIIICAEPLPVIAANDYKKKRKCIIISDVTEWYPENYLLKVSLLKRIINFPVYFLFNIYASNLADGIIVGEVTKKRRYNIIAPFKKKEIIGYYPVAEFFEYNAPAPGKRVVLCYAGLINFDRGILHLLEVTLALADKRKKQRFKLKLIGRFEHPHEESHFRELIRNITKIDVEICEWAPYPEFSKALEDADICFDLRKRNFIYRNSLPIKLFEYMACGKPFIYTDIKPIRKELDINKFGVLVNPNKQKEIIAAVEKYLDNKKLLIEHSINCRREIDENKNWEMESLKLLFFINTLDK